MNELPADKKLLEVILFLRKNSINIVTMSNSKPI